MKTSKPTIAFSLADVWSAHKHLNFGEATEVYMAAKQAMEDKAIELNKKKFAEEQRKAGVRK